jgi:transcription elongation factor GreA
MPTKIVYLTTQGRERFRAELHELVSVRRREVTERIQRAREFSEGDASESEEAMVDQAFIEGRINKLEMLLASARCIVNGNASDRVQLGSNVTIADLDMDEARETYRIVGSVEANSQRGLVSNESPIGKALLGRSVGEDVTIQAPAGAYRVRIVAVS